MSVETDTGFFDQVATPGDRHGDRHPARRVWMVLLMFVALLVVGYLAAMRFAVDRVPYGVEVAGVHIGGLSRGEATAALQRAFTGVPDKRITLTHDDTDFAVVPSQAGYSFDVAATLDAAGARDHRRTPGQLWSFFTGGRFTDPRVQIDEQKFSTELHRLTSGIGKPVREGSLSFTPTGVRPVPGRAGVDVDAAKVRTLIRRVMFDPASTRAELPVAVREPYVGAADVATALRTIGRPAMSGPVRFTLAGRTITATPADFAPALSTIPNGGRLVLRVDSEELLTALAPRMRMFGDKPRDATVKIVNGAPRVVGDVTGVSYDANEFGADFQRAVLGSGASRRFALHAAVQRPTFTTAQARALDINEKVGSFTVPVGSGDLVALAQATHKLDGTVVRPGRAVTLRRIIGPDLVRQGVGTLAGALYTAAYDAGYDLAHVTSATTRDSRFPVGRDVEFGLETGFTLTNDSDHGLLVQAEISGDRLTVNLWSTHDRATRVAVGQPRCLPDTGYEVTLVRTVRRQGLSADRQRLDVTYPDEVCPLPKTTPSH